MESLPEYVIGHPVDSLNESCDPGQPGLQDSTDRDLTLLHHQVQVVRHHGDRQKPDVGAGQCGAQNGEDRRSDVRREVGDLTLRPGRDVICRSGKVRT
jgi:hypothetical protein